jgi:osmotically-inducible protein OsmY
MCLPTAEASPRPRVARQRVGNIDVLVPVWYRWERVMIVTTELSADEKVQRDVLDEMHWDPQIEPTDVGVEVSEGVVTLTGVVPSHKMRRAASEAALRIYGVRGIVNHIEVKTPSSFQRTDTDIARSAAIAIGWDMIIPEGRVKVRVANGWITLQGTVDYFYQKQAAEDAVEGLMGVRGISNRIEVEPKESSVSYFELKMMCATTCATGGQAAANGSPIQLVLGASCRQPESGVLRLVSDALCVQLAGCCLHGKCRVFDRESARVLQRVSTDREREWQGRLVLAYGIEGQRWNRDRDVYASRPE